MSHFAFVDPPREDAERGEVFESLLLAPVVAELMAGRIAYSGEASSGEWPESVVAAP
jgi:hypothetical protein